MVYETITHKGWTYDIDDFGLVSPAYRRRGDFHDTLVDELPNENMVTICMDWLRKFATSRKTVNNRRGSYGLKHNIERWAQGQDYPFKHDYVTNGACILAAKRFGARIIPEEPLSPNAHFCLNYDKKGML